MKTKFSLVFVLFAALMFTVIIQNTVQQIQQAATIMVSHAGMPVLSRVYSVIDGDDYEHLAQTLDDTDPFFIETQSIIRALKNETQCLYLYTMARREDGTHYFVFDGEEPGTENYTHIGTIEDISEYDKQYLLTYETGMPQFTPMMHQERWGRLISAYMPIFNSAGKVVGIIGIDFQGEDIYQAIMSNLWRQVMFAVVFIFVGLLTFYSFSKDLSRQNERLNKLYRSKMDFLQDMSHEMKNPLTVIATGIDYSDGQIMEDSIDIPKVRSALGRIRSETQRLGRMVDSMVSLSAMNETGENRRCVNFASLLESGAGMFLPEMEKRGNTLHMDIAPDLPDVFVEKDRFVQVIANLLTNAAQHTRDGRVSIVANNDLAYVTVRVTDTGDDIPDALLPRVFERGVSGNNGTGYGLYICKTIVEAHGGTINIENGRENGTIVTFRVPVYGGQEAGHER